MAHLIGFDLPIVLDVQMLRPGEGEITAARRLLERLFVRYARFFDAVQGDALYWEGPLFALCQKHNKHLLAVLKDNNPALLADAKALMQGPPDKVSQDGRKTIRFWDRDELQSGAMARPVRVVRAEETTSKRERIAGQWVESQQVSNWLWGTSIPQSTIPPRQIAHIGHQRWKIENSIFNALSTHWGLDHCFHHDPVAILNFILIAGVAYILLACFHRFNIKPQWRQALSLIALAAQILIGIESLAPQDVPWRQPRGQPPSYR